MNITNNQFKRITKQFDSQNFGVSLFMKYYAKHGRGSFIDTLDSFAYLLGIDFNIDTLNSRYPIPYFVYQEGNIFNKQSGPSKYEDYRKGSI
jgi:hypothetical protein